MYFDELTITVRSGAGGRGCESYCRRMDHKRIPNGGDGGNGGNVIIRADANTGSLLALRSKPGFEAGRGEAGSGANRYGRNGEDFIIKVPRGTTVYNKSEDLVIRDLLHPGDEVCVAKGGDGGYGNHAGRPATRGGEGQEFEILLSLKIIADIFLVGLPNSGKTLLLRKLTKAKVEETHYPFATREPQLGTFENDFGTLTICELPSVHEGSEIGRGLGTHYLKHLERARLIFLMLDVESEFAPSLKMGYDTLLQTIEHFNPEFLKIPRFVVVNKMDRVAKRTAIKKHFSSSEKVFPVSVLDGTGIETLMAAAVKRLGKSCTK